MKSLPRPPKLLREAGKRLWLTVVKEYRLEPDALELLALACQAADRLADARAVIDEHGMSYQTKTGVARLRPEIVVERDSRAAVGRLLKQLGLDLEPVRPGPGRPPGPGRAKGV